MNYIFFGTPRFAALILEKLIASGMPPQVVVCNPDKPVGRKQIITPPPAKRIAEKHGIKVYQPKTLKSEETARELVEKSGKVDVAVVAAYGKLIPENILLFPKRGMVNIHPSLLPKYRGPTPIQSAIINGDEMTGVTLMALDEEIDHGPIIARRTVAVAGLEYENLERILAEEGAELLVTTLPHYISGDIKSKPQNHDEATLTKKFSTDDAFVAYADLMSAVHGKDKKQAEQIERMIRALNPEPGMWTIIKGEEIGLPNGKRVKLLEAVIKNNTLILKKIQVAGKKPQPYNVL